MATLAQFITDRATAGAAYSAACKALVDAFVECRACDMAAGNGSIASNAVSYDVPTSVQGLDLINTSRSSGAADVPSFNSLPNLPAHGPFITSPSQDLGSGCIDRVNARLATLLTTYATGQGAGTGSALVTLNAARASARSTVAGLRASAGAAYATAATSLANAYIELNAYDRVLENGLVGGGRQTAFSGPLDVPLHATYLPSASAVTGSINDRTRTRLDQLLATA